MKKFHEMSAAKQKAILLLTRQIIDPEAPKINYDEIAAECDVSVRQLFRWRQEPEFRAARAEVVDMYADEIVGDAFSALHWQVSKKRNVKAAEVLLKSRGMLVDRKEVSADVRAEVTEVSAQDADSLRDELEQLRRKLDGAVDQAVEIDE